MPLKLSHSQANRFQRCPKSYEFYYKKKYRAITKSAALCFGTAIDRAIDPLITQSFEEAVKVFKDTWTNQELNKTISYLPTSLEIVYADTDIDTDLLLSEDFESIKKELKESEMKKGYYCMRFFF